MEIYFACSITGGRQDEIAYQTIVHTLTSSGHTVPTAYLASTDVIQQEAIVDPREVYSRDTGWIAGCHALVAEVSTPSHGVGYEIAFALIHEKPVLCCYREGVPVSKMLLGNTQPNLQIHSYQKLDDLPQLLNHFISSISI